MTDICLYQPDQAGNCGTMLRLAACLGVKTHIIQPCGFPFSDKALKRSGMDYVGLAPTEFHASWQHFLESKKNRRVVLLTTKSTFPYTEFTFHPDDILMVGRESAGVPDDVHNAADARIIIPMQPGLRSVNVAVSLSMVLGEALRQTNGFSSL